MWMILLILVKFRTNNLLLLTITSNYSTDFYQAIQTKTVLRILDVQKLYSMSNCDDQNNKHNKR